MESERAFYMQAAAEAIPAADKSFDAVRLGSMSLPVWCIGPATIVFTRQGSPSALLGAVYFYTVLRALKHRM